jgi:hypothetical protein
MQATQRTQRAITSGSYLKAAQVLLKEVISNYSVVLDYGAGLGKGTETLKSVFKIVDSFEPYPQKCFQPNYTNTLALPNDYDAAVCLNVLNVVDKKQREVIIVKLIRSVLAGGRVIIGTRSWKNDIELSKTAILDTENKTATFVDGVVQTVFDGDDLKNLVREVADKYKLNVHVRDLKGLCKCAVIVEVYGK